MSPLEEFATTPRTDTRMSIPKPGATDGDDGALVALGREFDALSARLTALQREQVETPSTVDPRDERSNGEIAICQWDERIEALLALLDPIERAIMATPATTIVGLGVKARHAAQVLSHYWTDAPERLDWDARAVRLLIESTCNVAGVGLHCLQQLDSKR